VRHAGDEFLAHGFNLFQFRGHGIEPVHELFPEFVRAVTPIEVVGIDAGLKVAARNLIDRREQGFPGPAFLS
jgi:hypothetical protein